MLQLLRRAGYGAVAAEYAAIARLRLVARAAGGAGPEEQAGVGRHRLLCQHGALRAAQNAVQDDRAHGRLAFDGKPASAVARSSCSMPVLASS